MERARRRLSPIRVASPEGTRGGYTKGGIIGHACRGTPTRGRGRWRIEPRLVFNRADGEVILPLVARHGGSTCVAVGPFSK